MLINAHSNKFFIHFIFATIYLRHTKLLKYCNDDFGTSFEVSNISKTLPCLYDKQGLTQFNLQNPYLKKSNVFLFI